MSYLCTLIEFIQNLFLEDEEIRNMLKEIDEMNSENSKIESKLEEFDREHVRLQIEFHNLEMISSFNDISDITNLSQTSTRMYKDFIEFKNLIKKIDFTKILQCSHMEMEAKCRKEWQPIQDCFVRTLKWHEKMEQRHVVKKHRQEEIVHQEAKDAQRNQQKSMEKSLKQSMELINQGKERRNNLVIYLIKGSKDLNEFNTKMTILNQYKLYIESLRQEKSKLENKLEQIRIKAFNPILPLNNNCSLVTTLQSNADTSNFIMPKLPSFTDILNSFNQAEKSTNITSIENTTSICVKSILHTSKQLITTKQTKNVHFKMQLEEYKEQEETTQNKTESVRNIKIEEQPQPSMEINKDQEKKENLEEMECLENVSNFEIVDLLTPADNILETVKLNDQDDMDTTIPNTKNQIKEKPLIQDCIVFKTPFPIQEILHTQYTENVSNSIKASCSKNSAETYSSGSCHSDIKEILNTTKKTFYEKFLDATSSSPEASPCASIQNIDNFKKSVLKDFDPFAADNNFFFQCKEGPNEENTMKETSKNFATAKVKSSSEVQDFLDFGCNKRFAFDSDDTMSDNYDTRNMDFM